MKITYALPAYYNHPISGYQVHYEYADRLARRGHDVTILFPRRTVTGSSRLRAAVWQARIRLRNRPLVRSFDLDRRVRTRLVRDLGPASLPRADILIATGWQTAEALRDAPASAGRKQYIVYDYEHWMSADAAVRARMAATYRAPFRMIATSTAVAGMIEANGGTVAALIPCGLDTTLF